MSIQTGPRACRAGQILGRQVSLSVQFVPRICSQMLILIIVFHLNVQGDFLSATKSVYPLFCPLCSLRINRGFVKFGMLELTGFCTKPLFSGRGGILSLGAFHVLIMHCLENCRRSSCCYTSFPRLPFKWLHQGGPTEVCVE